jgi:hypothetical protein
VEVTDPREPLYGRRFRIESVSRSSEELAHVFLRRDDGIVLRVPMRATSLSTLVNHAPRAKLCKQAAQEFLDLVKEYELCPLTTRKLTKSGRRLIKKRDKKS